MLSLSQLKAEIDRRAEIIGASQMELPTYGHTEDAARPHIEADSRGYHYVVVERGKEMSRLTTNDLDDLLYEVFRHTTFSLACQFELAHRINGQDCRRQMFQKQVELLSILSPKWGDQESQEHEEILCKHPFDDASSIRAAFTRKLRDQGRSPESAWQLACERYPLTSPP